MVFSMCPSIGMRPTRSLDVPRKQRTIGEPTSLGGHEHALDLLLGCTLGRIECFRCWADRPHPKLKLDPKLLRMRTDLAQVIGLQVADEADLGKVDDDWRPVSRSNPGTRTAYTLSCEC